MNENNDKCEILPQAGNALKTLKYVSNKNPLIYYC